MNWNEKKQKILITFNWISFSWCNTPLSYIKVDFYKSYLQRDKIDVVLDEKPRASKTYRRKFSLGLFLSALSAHHTAGDWFTSFVITTPSWPATCNSGRWPLCLALRTVKGYVTCGAVCPRQEAIHECFVPPAAAGGGTFVGRFPFDSRFRFLKAKN